MQISIICTKNTKNLYDKHKVKNEVVMCSVKTYKNLNGDIKLTLNLDAYKKMMLKQAYLTTTL